MPKQTCLPEFPPGLLPGRTGLSQVDADWAVNVNFLALVKRNMANFMCDGKPLAIWVMQRIHTDDDVLSIAKHNTGDVSLEWFVT
jgi:hypothetical protein